MDSWFIHYVSVWHSLSVYIQTCAVELLLIHMYGEYQNLLRFRKFRDHVNPLTPTFAIMGTAVKHPMPDRVKPSFVIVDILAL